MKVEVLVSTMYKTSDGELYSDLEEAEEHEARLVAIKILRPLRSSLRNDEEIELLLGEGFHSYYNIRTEREQKALATMCAYSSEEETIMDMNLPGVVFVDTLFIHHVEDEIHEVLTSSQLEQELMDKLKTLKKLVKEVPNGD